MAKMHSRGRGTAHSNKPLNPAKPTWIRYKPKEIELLIGKLSKEGKTASEIGMILRDSYGVPNVKLLTERRLQQILGEKKLLPELPEDMMALMKKAVIVKKHMDANKQDMTAKRGLQLTKAKIIRLAKYYKGKKIIPKDWKY